MKPEPVKDARFGPNPSKALQCGADGDRDAYVMCFGLAGTYGLASLVVERMRATRGEVFTSSLIGLADELVASFANGPNFL
jgi:hypothetical protein